MDLRNLSTALFVKDIEASKSFYSGILGLKITLDFGKNVIYSGGLTTWEIREKHIIPSKLGRENISDTGTNRFEIYFETENLDEDFENLKKNGVKFLNGLHEEPWGQRTIRFFDPDNHLIEIGESMKIFVGRFYNEGLSVDEIEKRTSVPRNEIIRLLEL